MALSIEQLRAVGEMQAALSLAAREIKRAQRMAERYDISFAGINVDPLRAVYLDLAGQVMQHIRELPETRRATVAIVHAPALP
jgi:Ser/Thr protein kinase RdoA (MazF antagonist)